MKAPKIVPFRHALPLPTFILHPLTALVIAILTLAVSLGWLNP